MPLRAMLSAIALPTLLAACATTAPPMSDPQPPAQATCHHDAAQSLVGQPATAANVERARQLAGARTARVLKPGQMVTMEYIEGRLNVYVDEANVIKQIRCG
jgi:hypothetical protein